MAPEPDPTIFSPQELAVINICKKLGPLPSRVASEDIKGMASVFSEKAQEAVINSATVMGFLNRFMWVVSCFYVSCNGKCIAGCSGGCNGSCSGRCNGMCSGCCNGRCNGRFNGRCNGG